LAGTDGQVTPGDSLPSRRQRIGPQHALRQLSAPQCHRPYQDHLIDESEWCLCAIINQLCTEILNACSDASRLIWTPMGKGVRVWTVKIPAGSFRGPASEREGDHFLYELQGRAYGTPIAYRRCHRRSQSCEDSHDRSSGTRFASRRAEFDGRCSVPGDLCGRAGLAWMGYATRRSPPARARSNLSLVASVRNDPHPAFALGTRRRPRPPRKTGGYRTHLSGPVPAAHQVIWHRTARSAHGHNSLTEIVGTCRYGQDRRSVLPLAATQHGLPGCQSNDSDAATGRITVL